ncbi:protein-tyrosine phosphatase family protein [Endozoicomonas arenosclerae]|uniref:protein-tyrosine phosphatase family protein n=1 Tax=Endozoicomonas arenosclerae TaxID=1633495 RepID=UPI0015602106|nr:protein-tyrosine phosphatase family protein [Endozoicomonas arenosclerae]
MPPPLMGDEVIDRINPDHKPMAIVPPLQEGPSSAESENPGRQVTSETQSAVQGRSLPERTVEKTDKEKVDTLRDAAGAMWGALRSVPLPQKTGNRASGNILNIHDIGDPGDIFARVCSKPDLDEFFPFWNFILKEQIPVIVNINEEGLSGDYFPDQSQIISSGSITVTKKTSESLRSENIPRKIEKIKLRVKEVGQPSFRVKLYKITDWPDGSGYSNSKRIIHFCKKLISQRRPPLIHCQAGLGRSGALVLVMNLLLLEGAGLLNKETGVAKLAELINQARVDRNDDRFVTTPDQFYLLLRVLKRLTGLSSSELVDQVNNYCGLED